MLYDHDQCISLNILIRSAIFDLGFLSNAIINNEGITPSATSKIIPGTKKLSKGIFLNSDSGSPIISPVGDIISTMAPQIAPNAKNPRIIKKMLLTILTFIMFYSFLFIWVSIEMVCNGLE